MDWLKRSTDLLGAALGLIACAPIMLVIAIVVSRRLGQPIFFRQRRPGLGGRPFEMLKFRTMRDAAGLDGRPLPDAERLTPFGRFLRSTSLDELPELWNVLRGEMSLVGPRPLLMQYLDYYTPEQAKRHNVKPGITGLAQVNGRNSISWEEKFALDVWYVYNRSFWLDLRIIGLTVLRVIKRDGISADGQRTISEFAGSPDPVLEASPNARLSVGP